MSATATRFSQRKRTRDVETRLKEMFRFGHPVLLSSARSAFNLLIRHLALGRGDNVELFPYASHCVIDAVGRLANPVDYSSSLPKALTVTYHQWGYTQLRSVKGVHLEDSVDVFCEIGSELFPSNGEYELWSLSKIIGSLSGGVLWCKRPEVADEIRQLRDTSERQCYTYALRLAGRLSPLAHSHWMSIAPMQSRPCLLEVSEIYHRLEDWGKFAERRRTNIEIANTYLRPALSPNKMRLPCAVPLSVPDEMPLDAVERKAGFLSESGRRIFCVSQSDGNYSFSRVLPIPVHHEVDPRRLEAFAKEVIAQMRAT